MAVDAVLGEPVSGSIPCYQGNLQGILRIHRAPRWSDRSYLNGLMRLTVIDVRLGLQKNRELNLTYQGFIFA